MMDEEHKRMKPEVLAALYGLAAAGSRPPKDQSIPAGWECTSCGGTMSHHESCKLPRGLKKT